MKIEWFLANVRAVGFSDRAEGAILGVILARSFFGKFRPYLRLRSHFVRQEPPLES